MRWCFPQYQNEAELKQRRDYLERIDAWWAAFAENAKRISDVWDVPGSPSVDISKLMSDTLQQVDDRIMWEYGPAIAGSGHRLVITPEADHHLRTLVATLLERAPQLPGWEFYGDRLAESVAGAESAVKGRTGGSLDQVMVRVEGEDHHRIGLTFLHPKFVGPDDEFGSKLAFVATESLLGETRLDRWIGFIECDRLKPKSLLRRGSDTRGLITLDRLRPTVEAAIQARLDQLPEKPLHQMGLQDEHPDFGNGLLGWGTVSIDPKPQEDYPGRSDLFVAVTSWFDCLKATFTNRPFYSERFSKHGEVFCYLKTDGRDGFDNESWSDRGELEDELQAALSHAQAGGVWGGGTGRIYSYVEFALTDVAAGLEAIRSVLQRGNIHRRTWVMFHDQHLCQEWVGAYDETPAPPIEDD